MKEAQSSHKVVPTSSHENFKGKRLTNKASDQDALAALRGGPSRATNNSAACRAEEAIGTRPPAEERAEDPLRSRGRRFATGTLCCRSRTTFNEVLRLVSRGRPSTLYVFLESEVRRNEGHTLRRTDADGGQKWQVPGVVVSPFQAQNFRKSSPAIRVSRRPEGRRRLPTNTHICRGGWSIHGSSCRMGGGRPRLGLVTGSG